MDLLAAVESSRPLAGSLAGSLAAGVLLGLGAAVPPGPVNLEIARRCARGGFWRGASVGLGAVTVDVVLALLLVLGVLQLVADRPAVRLPLNAIGVALLAYLGVTSIRGFLKRRGEERDLAADAPAAGRGYATGLLLCGTSPYQAAFWLVAVPATLGSAGRDATSAALVCVGVFAATLAWVTGFASLMTLAASSRRAAWLAPAMDVAGGVVLLGFAALAAVNLGRELLA